MNNEKEWVNEVVEKIVHKMEVVAKRNKAKIPYTTENGIFNDLTKENPCWWTNGFWGGMMWQMYHATKNTVYLDIARANEEKLDKNLLISEGLDHDNGFKWLPTAVADYRETKNVDSRNRGILAANNLAGRFNPVGKYIRAWNDYGEICNAGLVIIDSMMNLPLLYWASNESNDPRFKQIAKIHADTVKKNFIREDGSACHIVEFDPATGIFIRSLGGQGYGVGSAWSRGQAWAVYGFALSYRHTNNKEYLETAKKVAMYFIRHIPEDGHVPVDFCQPNDCTLEDSSAAAIAACGFLELEQHVSPSEKPIYHNAAINLLQTLDKTRCNWEDSVDHLVEKCTAAFHDEKHEFAIIYGDYYFIEAIWRLAEQELFIW